MCVCVLLPLVVVFGPVTGLSCLEEIWYLVLNLLLAAWKRRATLSTPYPRSLRIALPAGVATPPGVDRHTIEHRRHRGPQGFGVGSINEIDFYVYCLFYGPNAYVDR